MSKNPAGFLDAGPLFYTHFTIPPVAVRPPMQLDRFVVSWRVVGNPGHRRCRPAYSPLASPLFGEI